MKLAWDGNQSEIRQLIDKVISHFTLNEQGNVSWTIGGEIYTHTLFKKLKNKPDISDKTLFHLFEKSIRQVFVEDQKIKKTELILDNIQQKISSILSENKKYTLVTTISINKSVALKNRIINDVKISFYNQLPKKYAKNRNIHLSNYLHSDYLEHDNYKFVVLTYHSNVDQRTSVDKMLESIDLYRGLLEICFINNHNFFADKEEVKYPTESGIKLGNYHTLHNKSGSNASNFVWYQQNIKEVKALSIKDIEKTEKFLTKYLNYLKKSSLKYKKHVIKSILLYIKSIDLTDVESRFLKLWTAIEVLLVNCDKEAALTERISFRYTDRSSVKLILRELRRDRNDVIHKGKEMTAINYKVFILKDFAEDIFHFFIKNPYGFTTPQHVIEFLNLSTDPKEIDEKIKRLKLVKKFLNS